MRAVILAGGGGSRLWPLSRSRRPKQFLPVLGGRSLLEETCLALAGIVPRERIAVVTGAAHRAMAEACLGTGPRIICEPMGRGTAPALGLAAVHLGAEAPDEVIVAVPADNAIGPGPGFADAVRAAARLAGEGGMAVVGTIPARPAPECGYIKPGERLAGEGGPAVFACGGFEEKPGPERAAELCAGGWLWYAGVLAVRPRALRREMERFLPELAEALAWVEGALGTPDYDAVLSYAWRNLPAVSLEEGILARGPAEARVVLGEYAWSDLGGWDAVREAALAQSGGANAVDGDALLHHARACLVRAGGGRLVALVGVEGLTVVDLPDALLVMGPGCGQELREVAGRLLEEGRRGLL